MSLLRCAKCGSDAGFLIETQGGELLRVSGKLPMDRIKKTVRVTCTYCNKVWDHVPMTIRDPKLDEAVASKQLVAQ